MAAQTLLSGASCNFQSKLEPIQGAVWHALNHYQYDDALILAERLYADNPGQDEAFLLATCHYRMNNKFAAKEILEDVVPTSSNNKFLYAKVLVDLKDDRALTELSGAHLMLTNNGDYSRNVSSFVYEFKDSASFALILAAQIHQQKGQIDRAAECFKMSLKHNPFLFTPFQNLCHIGKADDPDKIIDISSPQFFDIKDCTSPYKESNNSYDSNLKGEIPMRKQSKQALQAVTTNTITQVQTPPAFPGDSANPVQRTSSTPVISFAKQETMDFSPIVLNASEKSAASNSKSTPLMRKNQEQNEEMRKHMERMENGIIRKKKGIIRPQVHRNDAKEIRESGRRLFGTPPLRQTVKNENSGSPVLKENSETVANRRRVTRSTVGSNIRGGSGLGINSNTDEDEIGLPYDKKLSPNMQKRREEHKKQRSKEEAHQRKTISVLVQYYRLMGKAYLARSEHRFSQARGFLNELPEKQRETGWVLTEMARTYFDEHKYRDAVDVFKKIQSTEPYRLSGLEYYSTCLWRLEDSVALSALATKFVGIAKHRPETWCMVGNLFSIKQEHERAQKFFMRAVELCESQFNSGHNTDCRHYAYVLLGHELVLQNEFEKAIQCYRNALNKRPRLINAFLGIGEVKMKEEQFQEAAQIFQMALQYVSKNATIWSNMGHAYYELSQYATALKCFEKALKLKPNFPHAMYYRANVYYKMNEFDKALCELKKMDKTNPKEAMVNYMLGKVYHRLGQMNLSNVHMSYATELDPKGTAKQKENSDSMNQTADETAETNEWDTTAESGANSTRGRTLIDSGSLDLMGTSDQTASLQNLEDLLTDEPSDDFTY